MSNVLYNSKYVQVIVILLISCDLISQEFHNNDCERLFVEMSSLPLSERIYKLNDFEGTSECAENAANLISKQAKIERDSLTLSKVYAIMAYRTNPKYSLSYADSLITISSKPSDYYFLEKYIIKGYVYYFLEDPLAASHEFAKSYNLAKEYDDFDVEARSQIWIATTKEAQGGSAQALEIYFNALEDIDNWKTTDIETKSELRSSVLQSIIVLELNRKNPDNAEYFLSQFKNILQLYPDEYQEQKSRMWDGKLAYLKEDYDKAYGILKRELNTTHGSEKLDLLFTMGEIQGKKNNPLLMKQNFNRFDSVSVAFNLPPIPESKNVYLFLLNEAIKNNNKDKQLEYYDKLISIDSFLTANKIASDLIELPGYSINDIRNERDKLINRSNKKDYGLIFLGITTFVIIVALIFYFRKYSNAQKSLSDYLDNESIEGKASSKGIKPFGKSTAKKIDKEIEASVKIALHKLNMWEANKGFTDKDVDMNLLAKVFKTNRTYISKAVNVYKNKKFRAYITDLRMEHFVQTTKKDYDYRNKNLNTILEEFGFNSIDTFNRALKAKLNNNNITPAMYMKEIIKRNT